MELHTEHVVARDRRRETPRMFARRYQIGRVIGHRAIRMREVEVAAILDAVEETRCIRTPCKIVDELDRVPAHVRNLMLGTVRVNRGHALHVAGQDAQSRQAAPLGLSLVSPIEEQVHAEANSQEGHSVGDASACPVPSIVVIASVKAPTPGNTTPSAARISAGTSVMRASKPASARPRCTLARLPLQ